MNNRSFNSSKAAIEPQINADERRWEGNCRTGSPPDWRIADRPGTDSREVFYLRLSASICGFQTIGNCFQSIPFDQIGPRPDADGKRLAELK